MQALAVMLFIVLGGCGLLNVIGAIVAGEQTADPPSRPRPRLALGMIAVALLAGCAATEQAPRTKTVAPSTVAPSTDTRTTSATLATTTTTTVTPATVDPATVGLIDPNEWYDELYAAEAATSTTSEPEPTTTTTEAPTPPTVEPEPIIAFAPTVEHAETGGGAAAICAADAVSCVDHKAIGTDQRLTAALDAVGGDQWKAELVAGSPFPDQWFPWLTCTIYRESKWDPRATNTRNANGTVDRGAIQINNGVVWSPPGNSWWAWWKSAGSSSAKPNQVPFSDPIYDPETNLVMAYAVMFGLVVPGYTWQGQTWRAWTTRSYCGHLVPADSWAFPFNLTEPYP